MLDRALTRPLTRSLTRPIIKEAAEFDPIASYPFTSDLLDTVNGYSLVSSSAPTPSADGISITGTNAAKLYTTGWPKNDFEITFEIYLNALHNNKQLLDFFVSASQQWLFLGYANNRFRFLKRDGGFELIDGFATGTVHGKWLTVTMRQSSTEGISISVTGDSYDTTATSTSTLAKSDIVFPSYLLLAGTGANYKVRNFAIRPYLVNPSYCPDLAWVDALVVNATGAFTGRHLTITNDGGGFGNYYIASTQSKTQSSGKVSIAFKFISESASGACDPFISFLQGSTNIAGVSYDSSTGGLADVVAASGLATISPTIGEFVVSVTLDFNAGTAQYSYKLSDSDSPTALASLTVDGTFDNSNPVLVAFGGNVALNQSGVVEYMTGQTFHTTNADGEGFC